MSRVALVVTAAATAIGLALAGCSESSSSLTAWLTPKPSAPALQTLHFQSEPPGANVRTAQGQTCQTPCSLAVSPESQSVTFEKDGFAPQTVQVAVAEQGERSAFSKDPPPALTPNPGAPSGAQTDQEARRAQGRAPRRSSANAKFAGAQVCRGKASATAMSPID